MDIAAMNTRIVFQKAEHSMDAVGNDLCEWREYFSCFSTVSGTGGDETVDGDTTSVDTLSFTVRFCGELERVEPIEYRILFHGIPCNILHKDIMGYKKKSLKFKAKREV